MGLATAIAFAESGAAVTLADIDEAAVEGARDQLLATGHQALAVRRDVFDEADSTARVAMTVDAFGRLDAALEFYLDIARAEGARAAVGGRRPADRDRGWCLEPTIPTDGRPDMRVAHEEISVPVVSVLTYSDEVEAIAIANNSRYGLNRSVSTVDLDQGLDVAARIRTGTVQLNGAPSGLSAPTGGITGSGMGRENGTEGLDASTEPKAIGFRPPMRSGW